MTSREAFERWAAYTSPHLSLKAEDGAYIDSQTNDVWLAWKASRDQALDDAAQRIKDGSVLSDTSPAKLWAEDCASVILAMKGTA